MTTIEPTSSVVASVPRLSLRVAEAAQALGVSEDFFSEHVAHELRWVRRGRCKLVAISELERWLKEHAERVLEDARVKPQASL